MLKIKRTSPLKRGQQKKRWWWYLALACIVLAANMGMLFFRLLPTFQYTIATATPHLHLPDTIMGVNTISAPFEQASHLTSDSPNPCDITPVPGTPVPYDKNCLEGNGNPGTYTGDNKIQNPISKGNALFFLTPADITIDNDSVRALWQLMLALVDMLLALVIALNGLKLIFAGSVFRYSSAIENLPGVLLAIIVAHISLVFMTMMIGLNNNMTEGIYTFAQTNPNIHRSASGFGAGDRKDLILHVFFDNMGSDSQTEQQYEKMPMPNWQDAAKKWPVPPGLQTSTAKDLTQFNPDMHCTLGRINYDTDRRKTVFGTSAKTQDIPVYTTVRDRANNFLMHSTTISDADKNELKKMAPDLLKDFDYFGDNHTKWFVDWAKDKKKMDELGSHDYSVEDNTWRDQSNTLESNMSLLFQGGGVGIGMEGGDYQGDAIIYSCENDATGTAFQLVPDKLDFTHLFDNLQKLGDFTQMMAKILALMFLGQMIIRLFFINLYIITAPLGIACWALPGKVGQPVARLWLHGFISTVMVQFLMVVALIVIQVLLGNMLAFVGGDPQHPIGNLSDGTLGDIMRIACLWFVARIPSLIGNAPMRTLTATGQMMGYAVGTTISMQITQFQMITQVASSAVSIAAAAR
ncbi:hypothetical protein KSD_66480 [Ktedonobacter sp. SOSP1-85]|uniref:hypothetical protein n=1 Tax=Ktedonobacter sp. SOSP1-85 TaxID=2778367 RepID=UPI0019151286|nr:hypothetical protein [Ktedonobacter sp. SOSP1-85]GHO78877.1 hypothetical protein KSD_66480 [Ktedonobacter sp. SOSP1-85]